MCSDRRPLASSPLADGSADDSERGQRLLAESPTDRLANILPNFDQSSLEIDQLVAARTSEELLSPSSSKVNEELCCLLPTDLDPLISIYGSPTRQSQDVSLFETGRNATPSSIHPSISATTAFSSPNPFGQIYSCLTAVVFAVEEFEANGNSINRAKMDSIVACQKEAIKCWRSMLKCSSCTAKRENLMVFVAYSSSFP